MSFNRMLMLSSKLQNSSKLSPLASFFTKLLFFSCYLIKKKSKPKNTSRTLYGRFSQKEE